jgi:hypothetical protein
MTAPRAPQWRLLPPLRLAALALLCAGAGFLVQGWGAVLLWIAAVVFFVMAAIKFAGVWRGRA